MLLAVPLTPGVLIVARFLPSPDSIVENDSSSLFLFPSLFMIHYRIQRSAHYSVPYRSRRFTTRFVRPSGFPTRHRCRPLSGVRWAATTDPGRSCRLLLRCVVCSVEQKKGHCSHCAPLPPIYGSLLHTTRGVVVGGRWEIYLPSPISLSPLNASLWLCGGAWFMSVCVCVRDRTSFLLSLHAHAPARTRVTLHDGGSKATTSAGRRCNIWRPPRQRPHWSRGGRGEEV